MNERRSVSGWQLDGDSATAYERYLVPRFFGRWAERLLAHARVAPGEHVLDAGCGTGVVARTVATRVGPSGRVVGLDLNDGMVDEARRQDVDGRVQWVSGDLEAMPFAEDTFDVVLAQQALQFVSDRPRVLSEMHRVLRGDGRVALAVMRDTEFNRSYEVLAAALDRHAGRPVGDMMRSPFAGPDAGTLRAELTAAGFRGVGVRHDVLDVRFPNAAEYLRQEAASSPLAGALSQLDGAALDALITDLDRLLEPFTDDHGVAFPMETLLVDARR